MEMNSVMATEIVAAEVEHIVLPQIVSIKQASRMLGLHKVVSMLLPAAALQRGSRRGISVRHQVVHQLGETS